MGLQDAGADPVGLQDASADPVTVFRGRQAAGLQETGKTGPVRRMYSNVAHVCVRSAMFSGKLFSVPVLSAELSECWPSLRHGLRCASPLILNA